MTDQEIGFIGVGNMGAPMARRLLAAGHALVLYDPVEAAVAPLLGECTAAARSASEVGALVETVFVSV